MTKILNVQNLEKSHFSGSKKLSILKDISFSVEAQETFAIVAPSGSGKTTLLGLCAGLDQPDTGIITLCDTDMGSLSEDERAILRNQKVGFIFQDFQLLPTLTALENVAVPLELQGDKTATSSAKDLLTKVGLGTFNISEILLVERNSHCPCRILSEIKITTRIDLEKDSE